MNARTTLVLLGAVWLWPAVALAQLPPMQGHPPLGLPVPAGGLPDPGLEPKCEVTVDYLHWWTSHDPFPPLLTTSTSADAGVLGAPSTEVVNGATGADNPLLYGARLSYWHRGGELWGFQAGGFFMTRNIRYYPFAPPVLAVPVVDAAGGDNGAVVLSSPGSQTGSANIEMYTRLWGVHANGVLYALGNDTVAVMAMAGGRYVQLSERFRLLTKTTFAGASAFAGGGQPAGASYVTLDDFTTRNHFAGAQFGVRSLLRLGRWVCEAEAHLAGGPSWQSSDVSGSTVASSSGGTAGAVGGIFTQASNVGKLSKGNFSVVPQARLAFGYQFNQHARVLLGFESFYWADVVRPGQQIDPRVSLNLVPTPGAGTPGGPPAVARLVSGDFWAQGLTLTLDLSF